MLYREAGQFKSTYASDQQVFPIRQDRIGIAVILVLAFVVVPLIGNQYWLSAILTPFLIFALAALGLNILTGYAGQLSLGTAAFMAYLMSLCDRRVSATQYALLTSLSSLGQRVFGFTSGIIAGGIGWPGFFAVTAAMAIPGLVLVRWLPETGAARSVPSAAPPGA